MGTGGAGGAGGSSVGTGGAGGAGGSLEVPEVSFETCATDVATAKQKQLDMVLVVDRSGSMEEGGRWDAVTSAIQVFAADPVSDGIGVGLSYFPDSYSNLCLPCDFGCGVCFNGCCALPTGEFCWSDDDCDKGGICDGFFCHAGGGNSSCEVADYAALDVTMAPLPGVAAALQVSLAGASPGGGTPTGPAMQGALEQASALAKADPSKAVVVVLATDGEPTECQPQGIAEIAGLAAAAASAPEPVKTFVIGVGTSVQNLHAIAASGGSKKAFLVDANAQATQAFTDALHAIRAVSIACHYDVPVVSGVINYDLVNVTLAAGGKGPKAVALVKDAASCAKGGWYYDDPSKPKSLVLCPATCDQAKSAADNVVEIVYGCETVVN